MNHDKSPGSKSGDERDRPEFPQFTLWGLLSFFTATTVCISLVVSGARVFPILPEAGIVLGALAVVLASFFLSVAYRRLRLTAARISHWCGMGFGVLLAFPTMAAETVDDLQSGAFPPVVLFGAFCITLFGACSWSLLFSVPVFVVTMVVALVKGAMRSSRPRAAKARGADRVLQNTEQPSDGPPGVDRDDA